MSLQRAAPAPRRERLGTGADTTRGLPWPGRQSGSSAGSSMGSSSSPASPAELEWLPSPRPRRACRACRPRRLPARSAASAAWASRAETVRELGRRWRRPAAAAAPGPSAWGPAGGALPARLSVPSLPPASVLAAGSVLLGTKVPGKGGCLRSSEPSLLGQKGSQAGS